MSKKAHETALPKLRFPEFQGKEEWKELSLGNVLTESRISSKLNDPRKRITVRLSLNGVEKREFRGTEADEATYFFTRKKGQFIYGKQNLHKGAFGLIPDELDNHDSSQDLPAFDFAAEFHPQFFLSYLGQERLYTSLEKISTGTGSKRIHPRDFLKVKFFFPSFSEQQKIAATLSSLDALLTAQTAKLNALQAHKRGLMQNLFPAEGEKVPKRRFLEFQDAGEWTEKKLGNVLEFVMGNAFRSDEFTETGIQLIRLGNLYQSELQLNRAPIFLPVSFKNKYSNFLVNPSDLLMSMTGTLGKRDYGFVLQVPEECPDLLLNQRVLKITPKKNYTKKFVLHQLKHEVFLEKLYSIPGGTKQANLSTKHLSEIEILFPQIAEQQKIADCLSALDNFITAQSQKIDALKLHKKGLMQVLFPTTSAPEA
jgi:type I restriction enzyme S subunit